jgi:hypothetical protein
MPDKAKFQKLTSIAIDKLEGGYYHPNMLIDGRVKDNRYSGSGETMFGIDRLKGGSINTTPSGIKFWNLIDQSGAANKWNWNFFGGSLKPTLQKLASEMILSLYNTYIKLYIKSPSLIRIIENDDRLLFNFIYATWNGAGWFKKFATDLFTEYKKGITNPNDLYKVVIRSRINEGLKKGSTPNSLIAQGGNKIAKLFADYTPSNIPVGIIIILALAAYYTLRS